MPLSVRLTVRVPATLAQEVAAYAQAHQVEVSVLLRLGLAYALTQPPPQAPAPPAPVVTRTTRPPWTLTACVLTVLAQAPAGLRVFECWEQLSEGDKQRLRSRSKVGYTSPQALVGTTLRVLYRAGRIQRVGPGRYAPLP